VKLRVNSVTSTKTQIPFDYYMFPFCQPAGGITRANQNLGEFLAGDKISNSPYLLLMKNDMYCEQLCSSNQGRGEYRGMLPNTVVKAIRANYHNNWIVDNMNAASKLEDDKHVTTRYRHGFPIGFVAADTRRSYIFNHVNIEIHIHEVETDPNHYRVVRFVVEPFSIRHEFEPIDIDGDDTPDNGSYLPKIAKIRNPIQSCASSNQQHTSYEMIRENQLASGKVLL
jgi:transmembrane 9 superfamily protein 2/4